MDGGWTAAAVLSAAIGVLWCVSLVLVGAAVAEDKRAERFLHSSQGKEMDLDVFQGREGEGKNRRRPSVNRSGVSGVGKRTGSVVGGGEGGGMVAVLPGGGALGDDLRSSALGDDLGSSDLGSSDLGSEGDGDVSDGLVSDGLVSDGSVSDGSVGEIHAQLVAALASLHTAQRIPPPPSASPSTSPLRRRGSRKQHSHHHPNPLPPRLILRSPNRIRPTPPP